MSGGDPHCAGDLVKVSLITPGHAPKIGARWSYELRATKGGKPAAGKLTAQIVDAAGNLQPVRLGNNGKTVLNQPFKGEFRDYIVWPPSSCGLPHKLRITIHIGAGETIVSYAVTPAA